MHAAKYKYFLMVKPAEEQMLGESINRHSPLMSAMATPLKTS